MLLTGGLVLFVAGVTPWIAPLAVLFCLTLAIGQRTSWPFAVAASVIVELALIALIVRFTPSLGLGLVNGAAAVLGILGAAGLCAFALVRQPRLLGARALRIGVPVIVIPVLLVFIIAVKGIVSGDLEWAMHNDSVWNLVTTRMIVADGGLDAIAHPNSTPLTPGLLAVAIGVGRDRVAASDLLFHDVSQVATFWLLSAFGTSLLASLIGARSVHGGTRTARLVGAGITALIPLSWFTFGFAVQYGFYNATVTMLLLLASWLAWLETRVAPVAGAAVLSFASVALLATWAPLAIIPFALAGLAIVSRMASLARTHEGVKPFLVVLLAAIPVPLYVLAVTLPDLARDGGALAAEGGIFDLEPIHVLLIACVTLAFAVANAVLRHQRHQLIGVFVVCGGGLAAIAYLIAQRAAAGVDVWGYYPAKFAWLVCSLLLVILAASIAGEMAGLRGRRFATVGIATMAIAVPVALMMTVPPPTSRVASVLTPVAIATNRGVASGAPAAQNLFAIAMPGERVIAVNYLDPDRDRFLNAWLLQLESTSAADPIRLYSYILDPEDFDQVCEAVHAWDAPVKVITSSPATAQDLAGRCDDAPMEIDVRPRPQLDA